MNNYCSNPIRITRSASHYPHVLVFSLSNFKNWHDSRGSCSPCILYSHYVMMTCLSVTYRILKVTSRLLGHPKYNCHFCHNCIFVNTCMHYYNTILVSKTQWVMNCRVFEVAIQSKKWLQYTFSTLAMNISIRSEFPKFLVLSTMQSQYIQVDNTFSGFSINAGACVNSAKSKSQGNSAVRTWWLGRNYYL